MKEDDWEMPESELGKQLARASIQRAKKETDDMARSRKSAPGIQKELIKGARQKKKLPEKLQDLLEPCAEAIHNAATYKTQENEFKDKIRELMGKHNINEVELPNGGKLIYKPGKSTVTYTPPPKEKLKADGDSDGEGGEGEGADE